MSDLNGKRWKIVEELISSEETYLSHLNLILKYFVDPLQCNRLINHKDVNSIFGDIRSIRLVNQVLYDHLRTTDVGSAFLQLVHFLKLYASYARNFSWSQILLTKLIRTNKSFGEFVERQENLPALRGLKLPALLITPIQRIPRYKLLLEQLCSSVDDEESDKEELMYILQQINEIGDQINNCVEDFDNSNCIIAVQRSLDAAAPKLLMAGRKLLKTGKLTKIAKNGTKRPRILWLFTDALVYAKNNPRKTNAYLFSGMFPLRHCYVERVRGRNIFMIKCKNETLTLEACEYRVLDEWVNTIELTVKNLLEARKTLRKESSSSNPLRRAVLKNYRQHSSLSEKFRQQAVAAKTVNVNKNASESNSGRRLLVLRNFRRRLLNLIRRRSTRTHDNKKHWKSPTMINVPERRFITRSPILSVVEEEELKRASLSESVVCSPDGNNVFTNENRVTEVRRRPWWEEVPPQSSQCSARMESNKKSRCCPL